MRQSVKRVVLATLCLTGALTCARATDFAGRFSAWVPPDNPKCTCRFKGEHLPLGARRCLQTPQGPRTAECVTEQNVMSWRPSAEPCPQAGLPATPRS